MARAFVTGASGFIGSHLVRRLLERGDEVRCLVRSTSRTTHLRELGVELISGDMSRDDVLEQAVQGMDVVYHAAGLTSAWRPRDLMHINAHGTGRLARACARQATPPVFIYVSSVAAAGPASAGKVRLETDPPQPVSDYGRSKRGGELAAERFADRVPTTVVRPGIVFGPENREMLPIFKTIARLKIHAIAGRTAPPLSLIHVDDLLAILLLAAERGRRLAPRTSEPSDAAGYYFGVAPEYPDYAELGRVAGKVLLGRPPKMLYFAGPMPWILAGSNQLIARLRRRQDSFNLDKIREAKVPSWACSAERVERELGYRFPQPVLEQLEETVRWYRSAGWL